MNRTAALGIVVAFILAAMPARADEAERCATAAEQGQASRDRGKLREARDEFVSCAQASCPSVVKRACAGWLATLEPRLPSIVPAPVDENGTDLDGVVVEVDGAVVPQVLGASVAIDPGKHVVRFTREGRTTIEKTIVVHEGERSRVVGAALLPLGAPVGPPVVAPVTRPSRVAHPAAPRRGGIPILAWGLAGGAAVAFAVGTGFWLQGDAQFHDLRTSCSPNCSETKVDHVRASFLVTDIAFGVGIAALVAAGVVALGGWGDKVVATAHGALVSF